MKWLLNRDSQIYLALGTVELVLGLVAIFTHRHSAMTWLGWSFVALGILYIGRALAGGWKRRHDGIAD